MEICFTHEVTENLRAGPMVRIADLQPKMSGSIVSSACLVHCRDYVYYISNDHVRFLSMLRKSASVSNFSTMRNVCVISEDHFCYYDETDGCESIEYVIEYGPMASASFYNLSAADVILDRMLIIWSLLFAHATGDSVRLEIVAMRKNTRPFSLIGNFIFPNPTADSQQTPVDGASHFSYEVVMCNMGSNKQMFKYYDWLGQVSSLEDVRSVLINRPTEHTRSILAVYRF